MFWGREMLIGNSREETSEGGEDGESAADLSQKQQEEKRGGDAEMKLQIEDVLPQAKGG